MHIPLRQALSQLPLPAPSNWPEGVWDKEMFSHGSMSVLIFTPRGTDYQTAHKQDELYVVVRGSGVLVVDNNRFSFSEGDALFVPAGVKHHFEDFSNDLTT